MKKNGLFFVKPAVIFASLFLLISAASDIAFAQSKTKKEPRMKSGAVLSKPSAAEAAEMVEKVLLDFNEAVKTADFNDFYSKICRPWQEETSAEELQKIFQGFIDRQIDIGEIESMEVVFGRKPFIKKHIGYFTLVLRGYYPTSPNTTKFWLNFITDENQWKLSAIRVSTKPDR